MTTYSDDYAEQISHNLSVWLTRTEDLEGPNPISNRKFPHLLRIINHAFVYPQTRSLRLALLIKQSFLIVERYGLWFQWIPILEKSLLISLQSNLTLHLELILQLGQCFNRTSQFDSAIQLHLEAYERAIKNDATETIVRSLFNLCFVHRLNKEYDESKRYGTQALGVIEEKRAGVEFAPLILNELGLVEYEKGKNENLRLAKKKYEEALSLIRLENDLNLYFKISINLGYVLQALGMSDSAIELYNNLKPHVETNPNEMDKSKFWNACGYLNYGIENWSDAEFCFKLANNRFVESSGDFFFQASLNQNIGFVLLKQGRYSEAEIYVRKALKLWERLNESLWLANSYGTLGEILVQLKLLESAKIYYENALQLLAPIQEKQMIAKTFFEQINQEYTQLSNLSDDKI